MQKNYQKWLGKDWQAWAGRISMGASTGYDRQVLKRARELLEKLGQFTAGVNGTGHDIKRRYRFRRGGRGATAKGKQKDDKN